MNEILNKLIVLLAGILILTNPAIAQDNKSSEEFIELPEGIANFHQVELIQFKQKELGYSYRYRDDTETRVIDVYIYPVAEEFKHLPHKELVEGYLFAARHELETMHEKGYYDDIQDYGIEAFMGDDMMLLRSFHRIATPDTEVFSLIYLTEINGNLVKARASVPYDLNERIIEEIDPISIQLIESAVNELYKP